MTTLPAAGSGARDRKIADGFLTSFSPVGHGEEAQLVDRAEAVLGGAHDAIAAARLALEVQHGVDQVLEQRGPAIVPSLVTWPTMMTAQPVRLGDSAPAPRCIRATARPRPAPAAGAARLHGLDRVDHQQRRALARRPARGSSGRSVSAHHAQGCAAAVPGAAPAAAPAPPTPRRWRRAPACAAPRARRPAAAGSICRCRARRPAASPIRARCRRRRPDRVPPGRRAGAAGGRRLQVGVQRLAPRRPRLRGRCARTRRGRAARVYSSASQWALALPFRVSPPQALQTNRVACGPSSAPWGQLRLGFAPWMVRDGVLL